MTESGFDRFIGDFASRNLEARVKTISLFLLIFLVATTVVIFTCLNMSFEIPRQGSTDSQQKTYLQLLLEKSDAPQVE